MKVTVLSDRRHVWAFWVGCLLVTGGVALHLPMFWMARHMGFHLHGMAMDPGMYWGMALILVGAAVACWGLLPKKAVEGAAHDIAVTPPEDAPLTFAHWWLMLVMVVALVIDIMKPASLGFTLPGLGAEYGLAKPIVAWFPLSALTGTVVGSVVWGWLADVYGRRASILLSAVMFVGTAICGAMPDFGWNIFMCFLMGCAAGGMLPVTYALLAETMPSKHRGWSLVLVGGLGAVGGYVAASVCSAWLQPFFGWRVMWFLNLPTGLLLVLLSGFIPESARFLMHRGRLEEARATLKRFGSVVVTRLAPGEDEIEVIHPPTPPTARRFVGATIALTVTAIAWGLINFGLLLWLPAELVARGYSVELSSRLIAQSALIALPTVFACALLYSRWSTKWTLALSIAITAAGLVAVLQLEAGRAISPVLAVALLIVGSNAMLAILLPYTAESFPLHVRGRATGWVAACSKFGGLLAQLLAILAMVPGLGMAALGIGVPVALALGLVAWFGAETRGRDLRSLERAPG